jgi:hypothetical protein
MELHRVARPESSADELLRAPFGVREADLYSLRRALFGDRLEALAECVACGEVMEFELDVGALAARATAESGGEPLRVVVAGWEVEFRVPTVGDVAAAVAEEPSGDLAGAHRRLVARCVLAVFRDGRPYDADGLPEPVVRRLAEEAEQADPAGEVMLRAVCPECGAATAAELDIAAYLWIELDSWAHDTLLDIHLLAREYGWTEPEILALSPLRRRYYLELCGNA